MKKQFLLILVISFFSPSSFAQWNVNGNNIYNTNTGAVGIGASSPNSSAALDISSTTKGLLIPRMTSLQRLSIPSPPKGLLVFDTDNIGLWYYNGVSWGQLSSVTSNLWNTTGISTFTQDRVVIGGLVPDADEKLQIHGKLLVTNGFGSNMGTLLYRNKFDYLFIGPFSGTSQDGGAIALYGSNNNVASNQGGIDFNTAGTSSTAMRILRNGNVGIGSPTPSEKLTVAGNICFTGLSFSCSDIRYKTNILPIRNALSSILTLQGIYYNWNKDKFPEKAFPEEKQIGFSAQEVERIFPEIVQTNSDGYKSIDYSRLTPILVESIKDQQKQIDELKAKLDRLEKLFANR